jgi:hypothetical protein
MLTCMVQSAISLAGALPGPINRVDKKAKLDTTDNTTYKEVRVGAYKAKTEE